VTAFSAPDDGFERRIRQSFARQGIMAHLGASLGRIAPGMVEIRLPFAETVSQQHDFFHGGAVGTIADSAGGYAGFSLMPVGSTVLTVEYKLNLMAPAKGQALLARGEVVRAGRTLTVTRGEVFAEDAGRETLCAVMQQTLMCLPASDARPAG